MDNPQGKTNELDIAWLAGFLDGEGSFDLERQYAKELVKVRWRPRIRVSNTDVPTLEIVTKILDPLQVGYWVGWKYPTNPKWNKSWHLVISGFKRGLKFLLVITPYLHTRRTDAERLIDFAVCRLNRLEVKATHNPYSEREVHLIALIRGKTDNVGSFKKPSQTTRLDGLIKPDGIVGPLTKVLG